MNTLHYALYVIGTARSSIKSKEQAPKQGSEGAPEAWVDINLDFIDAINGITSESKIILLMWFHLSDRNILQCIL